MHADHERAAMVNRLRARGIADPRVLAAMDEIPRERFVPAALPAEAYADHPLDIGLGQTISAPWIVAFCAAALNIAPDARVLEVGTGSGYGAAVLARCCLPRADDRAAPAAGRAGPGRAGGGGDRQR